MPPTNPDPPDTRTRNPEPKRDRRRDPDPTPPPRVKGLRTPGSRTDEIAQRSAVGSVVGSVVGKKPPPKKTDHPVPPEHRPSDGHPFAEPAKAKAGREKPQKPSRTQLAGARQARTQPPRLNGHAIGSGNGARKPRRPKKRAS